MVFDNRQEVRFLAAREPARWNRSEGALSWRRECEEPPSRVKSFDSPAPSRPIEGNPRGRGHSQRLSGQKRHLSGRRCASGKAKACLGQSSFQHLKKAASHCPGSGFFVFLNQRPCGYDHRFSTVEANHARTQSWRIKGDWLGLVYFRSGGRLSTSERMIRRAPRLKVA